MKKLNELRACLVPYPLKEGGVHYVSEEMTGHDAVGGALEYLDHALMMLQNIQTEASEEYVAKLLDLTDVFDRDMDGD